VGGEELAQRSLLSPWLAMWLPNLLLGTVGLVWTLRACEVRAPWHRPAHFAHPRNAGAAAAA
jgi:hypothetical protein